MGGAWGGDGVPTEGHPYNATTAPSHFRLGGRGRRAIAAFDDRALNQVRMLNHQRNDLVVSELVLSQTQLAVNWLARAQDCRAAASFIFANNSRSFFLVSGSM